MDVLSPGICYDNSGSPPSCACDFRLEANVKVNGRGPFSHPHPSETPQPILMSCQIYYHVPQGVDVQNLAGIDSAATDLRMREKNTFRVDF